jgi:methylated-DNA-protein-cysteine methyltransferase-like protein
VTRSSRDTRVPPPPGADERPPDQPLTEFQRAVVDVVSSLAAGDIVTYGDVAVEIGRPGAAQAVANVLRRVHGLPWWRVIPTSGRLYRSHEPTQRPLLEAEGVAIGPDRRVRS